jgi:hypothetical protein
MIFTKLIYRSFLVLTALTPFASCSTVDDSVDPGEPVGSSRQAICKIFFDTPAGNFRWHVQPDGHVRVPISISSNVFGHSNSSVLLDLAAKAMGEWEDATRNFIDFDNATQADLDSGHYLMFDFDANDQSCVPVSSQCARCAQHLGPTRYNLKGCGYSYGDSSKGVDGHFLHEMGHVLGFDHVQQRSDRNRYLLLAGNCCFDCGSSTNPDFVNDTVIRFSSSDPRGNIGLWDDHSLMLYSGFSVAGATSNCNPAHCASDDSCTIDHGDRSYVGRNKTDGTPCSNDIFVDWDATRITDRDASWMVELYRTANRWQPFASLGYDRNSANPLETGLVYSTTNATNSATAVGSPGVAWAGAPLAFVRGSDGSVYGRWSASPKYDRLPGTGITSDPSAVSWSKSDARIDVVAFTGATVSKIGFHGNSWEPAWTSIGAPPAPVTLTGTPGPAIASSGLNKLEVFVRGSNGRLYWTRWNGTGWSTWETPVPSPSNGIQAGTRPAVAAIDGVLFVVVRGTDGALYQRKYNTNTSTWDSSWATAGLVGSSGVGSPALSVAPTDGGGVHADLYVRDASNGWLYQQTATQSSAATFSWTGASFLPLGGSLKSDPAAVAAPSTDLRLHVFAVQQDDVLWHKQWPCTNGCDAVPSICDMAVCQ